MTNHACPVCGQQWVHTFGKAVPGYRETDTQRTRVPVTDIDGRTVSVTWVEGNRWVSQGAPVNLVHSDDDGLVGSTLWACGDHIASIPRPLFDAVPCLSCRPRAANGAWWKEAVRDCSCCGLAGRHLIPRVPEADYTTPVCGAVVVTP